jgi:hypothetical protein
MAQSVSHIIKGCYDELKAYIDDNKLFNDNFSIFGDNNNFLIFGDNHEEFINNFINNILFQNFSENLHKYNMNNIKSELQLIRNVQQSNGNLKEKYDELYTCIDKFVKDFYEYLYKFLFTLVILLIYLCVFNIHFGEYIQFLDKKFAELDTFIVDKIMLYKVNVDNLDSLLNYESCKALINLFSNNIIPMLKEFDYNTLNITYVNCLSCFTNNMNIIIGNLTPLSYWSFYQYTSQYTHTEKISNIINNLIQQIIQLKLNTHNLLNISQNINTQIEKQRICITPDITNFESLKGEIMNNEVIIQIDNQNEKNQQKKRNVQNGQNRQNVKYIQFNQNRRNVQNVRNIQNAHYEQYIPNEQNGQLQNSENSEMFEANHTLNNQQNILHNSNSKVEEFSSDRKNQKGSIIGLGVGSSMFFILAAMMAL